MKLTDKQQSLAREKGNILIIGDMHEPFCLPGYREHCYEVANKFKCSRIISIGDEVDSHAISYHESDPDGHSAGKETELAQEALYKWYKTFPVVDVMIGNHTELFFRKARTIGLPKKILKTYKEIWEAPKGWNWHDELIIDDILFKHGTGASGPRGAINTAIDNRMSAVIGHIHSFGGVQFLASSRDLIFGMNVGCGIDAGAYAMHYGKAFNKKPTIGCGVVLGGKVPFFVPMQLGSRVRHLKNKR